MKRSVPPRPEPPSRATTGPRRRPATIRAQHGIRALRAGRGPRILMLHGIGSSATAWSRQLELLGSDFCCIAPDLPGYGNSPDPTEDSLDGLVDQLADSMEGQPAHVVGVSFGALTALALARRHPELVLTLVLADATLGRATLSPPELAKWLEHRRTLSASLVDRALERAREIASPQAETAAIEEIAAHMRRARPAGYMAVASIIARTDARDWLRDIDIPALVLCGEHDSVTGAAMSDALAAGLPKASTLVVAASGHAPHIEQPARFADAVRTFIGEYA